MYPLQHRDLRLILTIISSPPWPPLPPSNDYDAARDRILKKKFQGTTSF